MHAKPAAARALFSAVGARWIGLEAHRGSLRLEELAPAGAAVLALGAEGPGLSAETRALLDASVTLPLGGRLESLNVAVAAALVLARLVPAVTPP